ncbi:transcriptional regulator [Actinomadura verrucosospora]|uniref:Transcriptional regulator n=1 Tax=Actinomadura verrucosospora TaxID=46165 RepID=A0A7D4AIY5_ACTVE|nr:transcriptional regulator [Actinomadura verrucosospora]QKG19868.1 transcriptional regulator [Actinomadura verrucosospora]
MAFPSAPEDLALHGVRVLGFSTTSRVASRYRLDVDTVQEALLDFEARGWVRNSSFAGDSGWSLTDAGRAENERRLAGELDRAGARDAVTDVHAAFVPLNRRFGAACTDWQIRPTRLDPMAFNDHTDWAWDERVLRTLASVGRSFTELCGRLTDRLARFDGYADRYSSALRKVDLGQRTWVDGHDRDSCHILWIQFHEDLLATLGIERGSDT